MTTATAPPAATMPTPATMPTRALGRAVGLVGLLAVLAVLLGRVDLVVLAAPLAAGTAWSLRRRPNQPVRLSLSVPDAPTVEGNALVGTLRLSNGDDAIAMLVVARVWHSRWLDLGAADRPYATELPPGTTCAVRLDCAALRWGRHDLGPAWAYSVAADGLLTSRLIAVAATPTTVYPMTAPFRAGAAMPLAAGLVGAHRSRRPGEGGELAGVRQFGPGDRLRRIDWRVTLRTRVPHVAQTLSDRDADVVLLLDTVVDAGRAEGFGRAASVLDTAVRAGAAIAEYYLHRGDRVCLIEHSARLRRLRPAGGRRHYQTALEWLLGVRAAEPGVDLTPVPVAPHQVPPNALTVVLTPLLAEASARMVAELARAGRLVVALDTLGVAGTPPPAISEWSGVAFRLWRLEREHLIGQLREVGVPVVAWSGPGSLDQVLRDAARLATAPRLGR